MSASTVPAPRPPLRVALAGIGVVGGGVVRLLEANRDLIARRAGRPVEIVAISARDRHRDRGIDLARYRWEDDMGALVAADDVDVVVEMIGGADGAALTLARQTLGAGKALVTANKAMIAHHGLDLARLAEEKDTPLKYEAAVAGGIPVIKAIREGASANEIARVYGILNGTCNYILTQMERNGASFAEALAAAQAEGYAEADPTFDVDGIDAAHKLSILAALCFGTKLDIDAVTADGIRNLTAADIREAEALGHRVRLIGMAERDSGENGGGLYQHVQPCLVPSDHPLAYVPGALNAVVAEGNFVGRLFFEGAGAGAGPTASAIVADIIDIARDEYGPAFAMPVDSLDQAPAADAGARIGKHYVRLIVEDRIGVLAEIAAAMRDAGVSIESLIQRGGDDEDSVIIVLVTHEGPANAIHAALGILAASDHVVGTPMHMPILAL
ncbi:homoserine dehydrogenase [Sphingopyxis macrogoltabida]|uniref:Homoserine dehydrogenase n=1 Tax=Sphingopyxis macrogoltabida TaxID=33050 RepID=A0AAC9AXZ7_SPHMC|nr:homoserine dehydrogenase [Sphingopyxis macrogoltabida]ALJ15746.1 homoserine dehydrogenase [Sphingopyxis macrogoltabida]AMU91987.1 homoserine dehydrogenase [Sphingopyxis macrogoltabida]